jgi:hypothetical protein
MEDHHDQSIHLFLWQNRGCLLLSIEPAKMIPAAKSLEVPRATSGAIGHALWRSAIDAFWKTILMLVMGNIALGLLGGVFSAMAPSLPPFLAGSSAHTNPNSPSLMHSW